MSRSNLLSPALRDLDTWEVLAREVDTQLNTVTDLPVQQILWLREPYPYIVNDRTSVADTAITDFAIADTENNDTTKFPYTDIDILDYERAILIYTNRMLGFSHHNSGLFTVEDLRRLHYHIGKYWTEKGTTNFLDFYGMALNSVLKVSQLWTNNYSTFLPEGDSGIGTPIYTGGTWYPTSHVDIHYDLEKYGSLPVRQLADLFYYVAPINLVLRAITLDASATANLKISMVGQMEVTILTQDDSNTDTLVFSLASEMTITI